jgi:hypothetical protein
MKPSLLLAAAPVIAQQGAFLQCKSSLELFELQLRVDSLQAEVLLGLD